MEPPPRVRSVKSALLFKKLWKTHDVIDRSLDYTEYIKTVCSKAFISLRLWENEQKAA